MNDTKKGSRRSSDLLANNEAIEHGIGHSGNANSKAPFITLGRLFLVIQHAKADSTEENDKESTSGVGEQESEVAANKMCRPTNTGFEKEQDECKEADISSKEGTSDGVSNLVGKVAGHAKQDSICEIENTKKDRDSLG